MPLALASALATAVCNAIAWQTAAAAWGTAGRWLLFASLLIAAAATAVSMNTALREKGSLQRPDAWLVASGCMIGLTATVYHVQLREFAGADSSLAALSLSLAAVAALAAAAWQQRRLNACRRRQIVDFPWLSGLG